ncbi:MAG: arylsulfatase [Gammaproteobacteria bacterium]|nr:MAG: arylsulfatase [Gammaproteobacteria bacterium]
MTWRIQRACLLTLFGLLPLLTEAQTPPNIVILLADDVGFSDFGAYGSEVSTPNIDALAAAGMQFANFHVSPNCAPTRAMLLTGVSNHRAGLGNIPETVPPEQRGHPSYLGRLRDDVVTIASMLRAAGYRTYVTGKWHLGHEAGALPDARGFDRSFVLDASGADNWEQRSYLPYYAYAPWFEDGRPGTLPDDFYSSEFVIDQMIDYIDGEAGSGRPFFAYVNFQAIHIPVQAPREFTERYIGVYEQGWDVLREARFRGVMERGLLPPDTVLGPMPEGLRSWNSLDAESQRYAAKAMAVNAGMLEAMDLHIGRLKAHLKSTGEYERTLFVVLSDNGPEPNQPLDVPLLRLWLRAVGYSTDYETLGERGSYVAIGPEFASAAAAPGAFFKFHAGEGGIRVPLIIAGPDIEPGVTQAFSFVTDLVPSLLDLVGLPRPASVDGVPVQSFSGRSLAPLLHGEVEAVYGPEDVAAMEVGGNVALFRGDYKLVRNMPPYGDGSWQLYDISRDPGETRDLSASEPDLKRTLRSAYEAYAEREGVLELPAGYDPMVQMTRATRQRLLAHNWPWLLGVPAAGIVMLAPGWRLLRRRSRQNPEAL